MLRKLMELLRGHKGQTMVEYALILVLISIVAIVIMGQLGLTIQGVFTAVRNALIPAAGG
ncbi:Flp family type IVb pilin [Anaeromusa acidaminophila]|uniref:Flp family type IVb pilin n=1 Tax=Anaeromusa acidaminophila TaxID=81464 RepID=UPI000378BA79|nr:Flp family type IVb pilin [Anaeromusa acidaminophila]